MKEKEKECKRERKKERQIDRKKKKIKKWEFGLKMADLNSKPTKKMQLPIMQPDESEGRGGLSGE